jgi:hypothetical protein
VVGGTGSVRRLAFTVHRSPFTVRSLAFSVHRLAFGSRGREDETVHGWPKRRYSVFLGAGFLGDRLIFLAGACSESVTRFLAGFPVSVGAANCGRSS